MKPLERQPGDEIYTITFEDTPVVCHRRNTFIYEFDRQPEGDHVFIASSINKKDQATGMLLCKKEVYEKHNKKLWSGVVASLIDIGCRDTTAETMDKTDVQAFCRRFGRLPVLEAVEMDLIQPVELTPRQINRVNWLGYVLQNELLVPEHFGTPYESTI
jgi:hypothetical protein